VPPGAKGWGRQNENKNLKQFLFFIL